MLLHRRGDLRIADQAGMLDRHVLHVLLLARVEVMLLLLLLLLLLDGS